MMRRRARILVIDDDPLFRRLIVSVLEANFDVSIASDGAEGFHSALEHPPDIILLDVRMPVWDGPKTVRALRAQPSLDDVKIVILSGYSCREEVLDAIHAGADEYLPKSEFTKEDLIRKLEKLLSTSGTGRPAGALAASLAPRNDAGTSREPIAGGEFGESGHRIPALINIWD